MSAVEDFHVELDAFTGPLDLLLYLVKKEEVDIADIPIARITNQYLNYVEWIQRFEPDAAGAFLVMAATLIEIKSRMLLPTPPPATDEEEWEDPRREIVRQLMEYREMKEAAAQLAARAEDWAGRVGRPGEKWPEEETDVGGKPLEDVSLWTLFEAFNEILRQTGEASLMHITADDTPMEVVVERLLRALAAAGATPTQPVPLRVAFTGAPTRAAIVAVILALLELIRDGRLRVWQREKFGEILVAPRALPPESTALTPISGTGPHATPTATMATETAAKPPASADTANGAADDKPTAEPTSTTDQLATPPPLPPATN